MAAHADPSIRAVFPTIGGGGGILEILHWNLAAGRWIGPVDDYAGAILLLERSEETPPAVEVFRMLRNAGERGLLSQWVLPHGGRMTVDGPGRRLIAHF